MIEITIPGKPVAKRRPRFARRGKFVTTYNDQETEEGRFLFEVQKQFKNALSDKPLIVVCVFEMPRPKNHYGTGRNTGKLKEGSPKLHTKKPDIDNLIKFVLDCLNGIAWKDDSQIVRIVAEKSYSEKPSTLIQIVEVD